MIRTAPNKAPRKNEQKYSEKHQRIFDFLFENGIAVLSSVGPNGDPHGVVIYYTVNRDFVMAFLTKSGTKKYDNLKYNNHVMLTVFEARTQTIAQITGRAKEITDGFAINAIAAKVLDISLKTSDAGTPPPAKLLVGEYVAFEIEPVQVRMAVYLRPESGNYNELFESIESFELKNTEE